jgi:OmpA-OmpF porin, OOP family
MVSLAVLALLSSGLPGNAVALPAAPVAAKNLIVQRAVLPASEPQVTAPSTSPRARPLPPPPPPPPPRPHMDCLPGPFIIYFPWDSTAITPPAAAILDNGLAQYAGCGNARITLAGFADRSGPPPYNARLSQRRADAVKAWLVAHGAKATVVVTRAFGEDRAQLRVPTDDGVQEVQNRRVEISYGPAPEN